MRRWESSDLGYNFSMCETTEQSTNLNQNIEGNLATGNQPARETAGFENESALSVNQSAAIFSNVLLLLQAQESPFAHAPFLNGIAQKYLNHTNQAGYFATEDGFGASIIVRDGVAEPNIDLNIQEGLASRNLKKRIAKRIGRQPTDEEILLFAAGHELAHLIQAIADFYSIEDQDISGMSEAEIDNLSRLVNEHNEAIRTNTDIAEAQSHFRSLFGDDISRDSDGAFLDPDNYSDADYLNYINSEVEANADFIALWILGMVQSDFPNAPQNQGYELRDWKIWAERHTIMQSDLT